MKTGYNRLLSHIALTVLCLMIVTACPVAEKGTDGASSGSVTDPGGKDDVPAEDLKMPARLLKSMDFPPEYRVIEVNDNREGAHVVYTVNPPKTQEIAQLHLTDLQTRGYTCDDNPSRILEGLEFTGGEWRRVFVKVTEEYDKGTVVTIDVEY